MSLNQSESCKTQSRTWMLIALLLSVVTFTGCGQKNYNWALNNDGRSVGKSGAMKDVDIDVCEIESAKACLIAIIDSGIADDEYMQSSFDVSTDGAINFFDITSEHATEIASIIDANNFENGFAYNVRLLNIRISEENLKPEALIKAIDYAENMGAKIVNCSFNLSVKKDDLDTRISQSKMLFVCAAGNSHREENDYPASLSETLDNVISVAGIDCLGLISSNSNYGLCITIAAPGENVKVNDRHGNNYEVTGTSYATAYVTGVIGNVWALYPELTAQDIKTAVINSTKHLFTLQNRVETEGVISMEKLKKYLDSNN